MFLSKKGEHKMNKLIFTLAFLFMFVLISACSNSAPEEESHEMDHSTMEHSSSGAVLKISP